MKWPRSLFERLEEWFFKIRRSNPFSVLDFTIDEAERFRGAIEKTNCPACKQKGLKLGKFERGPKGWEADISCDNCNFSGTVSSLCSVLHKVDSKGKARDTS